MSELEAAELANLLLVGLFAGNDLGHWGVVHRALNKIPVAASFLAERSMFRRYRRVMPVLWLATVASGVVVSILTENHSTSFWLAVFGTIGVFLWQGVAASLYPLNRQILEGPEEAIPDPETWANLRKRWYARHTLRVALVVGAFVAFLVSALIA
jgi:hypothetical protein